MPSADVDERAQIEPKEEGHVISLAPFLLFDGTCAEAMDFYQGCLGGQLTVTKLGDTPMRDGTATGAAREGRLRPSPERRHGAERDGLAPSHP